MYTTRFPQIAKSLQHERQMAFESVDAGRIHRQVLDGGLWLSLAGEERNQRMVLQTQDAP